MWHGFLRCRRAAALRGDFRIDDTDCSGPCGAVTITGGGGEDAKDAAMGAPVSEVIVSDVGSVRFSRQGMIITVILQE